MRTYATTVEEFGYQHILAYDHVLGADPSVHEGWSGPYDVDTTFHEPLVLFGFLAAITVLELVTGIVILPQRPTALVAKQAAEVDLLSNGRLRLGVGLGWNAVEYEALGQDFSTRGRRLDEQVPLLRRLWTERSVTHHGNFEHLTGAGIAPLPVQRPIPVWFGAASPPAYRRAGRLADGWFPMFPHGPRSKRPGPSSTSPLVRPGAIRPASALNPGSSGARGHQRWPSTLPSGETPVSAT